MKKIFVFIIIYILCFSQVFGYYEQDDTEIIYESDIKEVINTIQQKPVIYAKSAILFDRKSKRVMLEKNSKEKIPNASTTKILTAIVAYENGNIEDFVTISKKAAHTSGSRVKLQENDRVSLNDLLYGLLLCSGNDSAVAIAEHIGGDVEGFCEMMNEKAKEIGALETNFTSPHGLDDEGHYSTAYDLALIADYALSIPYIAEIVKTKTALIRVNGRERGIGSTNEMLSCYLGADGVKTGYTGNAGRCLVTSATRDGWQLISVVLGCNTKKQRTTESIKLLNYGFQNFEMVDLCKNMKKDYILEIYKSKGKFYKLSIDDEFWYPLLENEKDKIEYQYIFEQENEAPIRQNQCCGEVVIKLGENVIKRIEIRAENEIKRKEILDYFMDLLRRTLKIRI